VEAKNLRGFKQIWRKISSAAMKNVGKAVMDHAWKHLRLIGRKGVKQAMLDMSKKKRA